MINSTQKRGTVSAHDEHNASLISDKIKASTEAIIAVSLRKDTSYNSNSKIM